MPYQTINHSKGIRAGDTSRRIAIKTIKTLCKERDQVKWVQEGGLKHVGALDTLK